MRLFDSAKDSLKGAVGDMAEGSVDSVRDAVQEVLQQQLEDLLGKAVVKMIASVNEELQTFAALHLATKEDIARLEALVVGASATAASGPARPDHSAHLQPRSRPAPDGFASSCAICPADESGLLASFAASRLIFPLESPI